MRAETMVPVKHIIFDLGNVLVNIHPERTMQALAASCGKDISEIRNFFLSQAHLKFMKGVLSPQEFHREFSENFECRISFTEFIAIWNDLIGNAKEGIAEIVEQLYRRFTLSVCSNTDPVHWEIARRTSPFLNKFQQYFLSFEMKCLKPDAVIFRRMLASLAVPASQCIFVDDTEENILQANRIGLRTIHAQNSQTIRAGLSEVGINIISE